MEDEILKRNTDCVYFLASPLTCKKGCECEFRHSESARLNPRDCWYWLNGNCLNPTCAFRHPPLEGLTETPSDSVHLLQHSVETTSKPDVPCYFYFNTYCMKGDQCPFLHSINDILPDRKFPRTTPEVISAHPEVDNKTSTGSDTVLASVEAPVNLTKGTSKELITQIHLKDVVERTAPSNISEEPSPSPELSMPEHEDHAVKLLDSSPPVGEYINNRTDLSSDESSEELVKDPAEPEERWESSPGFDVLVDDGSEQLAYEDAADYLLVRERESERLHGHLMHYDYEDSAGYDLIDYPDAGFVYDHGLYDSYDHLDDGYTADYVRRAPEHSSEGMLEPMFHRKRRLLPRERGAERLEGVDLRDHLRKRARMGVCQVSHSSRKSRSSHINGGNRERPMRLGIGHPFQGRLPSEVGRSMIASSHEMDSAWSEHHWRGGRWGYRQSSGRVRSRQRDRDGRRGRRERPPPIFYTEIPKGLASKETRPALAATNGFTGPKTLEQIKEERSKANTGGDAYGNCLPQHRRRATPADFQGPKPLSELLKDKRKPLPASDGMNGSASKYEHIEPSGSHPEQSVGNGHPEEDNEMCHNGTADRLYGEFESDFSDDEDEDGLTKKVAGILS